MSQLVRPLGLLIALALGACATAKDNKIPSLQAFDNYRQLLRFDFIAAVDGSPQWQDAPIEMRRELALCTADFALGQVDPAAIGALDTYARDPAKLPIELRAETVKREADAMSGSTKDGLAPLMPYCKDDAAAISKYAR